MLKVDKSINVVDLEQSCTTLKLNSFPSVINFIQKDYLVEQFKATR